MDRDKLKLTDFMDLPTLQEIQDAFAAVAQVRATITDADGQLLTQATPTREFLRRQKQIADQQLADEAHQPQRSGREYVAPIVVRNQRVGTIRMAAGGTGAAPDEAALALLAEKLKLEPKQLKTIAQQLARARDSRPAAIHFLFVLANAIARLCFQEHQLRSRLDELTTLYNVTMTLSDSRELNVVLHRTAELVTEVMGVKATSIRLLDEENQRLVTRTVHNLSRKFMESGVIPLDQAEIDRAAMGPEGYAYVDDMRTDPRVPNPAEAEEEGVVSLLSVGMRYKGRSIGVLRVYTGQRSTFSPHRVNLLKSVAAQAAAAIENARLATEAREAEAIERQLRLAADVQQRMLPSEAPNIPGLDVAAIYVPCFELGGDLYDWIPLPYGNLGLAVADVSGKGVPASLIMASVRAYLRAQVDNVYYLYEILRRLNLMLCRDTKAHEFVTLFYGVIDTGNRRLTYANAGHPPAMVLRRGRIIELGSDNMVLGVDAQQSYSQSIFDLESGDTLLVYTDGLTDAMNFQQQTFSRHRVREALLKGGATAELVAQGILWEMRRFAGLQRRNDDITMIVVKVK